MDNNFASMASDAIDSLLHPQPRKYTKVDGNIKYLDGDGLKRPLIMPKQAIFIMGMLVIAGIFIGIWLFQSTAGEILHQRALSQSSIETNLAREASIDTLPNLASYIVLSDEDIKAAVVGTGAAYYDATSASDSGITIYKLPSDVSAADAAILYTRGISNLTASQATLLLNGSWSISTSHDGLPTIVVRYADFKSTSVESAISSAMTKQGIDATTQTEAGIDDSGNTYRAGTITANDATYNWRISGIDLSEMYNVSGLPSSAYYIGIRLTQAS